MAEKFTDEELRPAILRWIEVTQQLDQIGHKLGRIKEQYGELQYPAEIESLSELEPIDRRKRELGARQHDLRGQGSSFGAYRQSLCRAGGHHQPGGKTGCRIDGVPKN